MYTLCHNTLEAIPILGGEMYYFDDYFINQLIANEVLNIIQVFTLSLVCLWAISWIIAFICFIKYLKE